MNAIELIQCTLLNVVRKLAGTRFAEDFFCFFVGEGFGHGNIIAIRYYCVKILSDWLFGAEKKDLRREDRISSVVYNEFSRKRFAGLLEAA